MSKPAFAWAIPLLFVLLIACDTFSQVLFKYASLDIGEASLDSWPHFMAFVHGMLRQPAMSLGLLLLLGAFVCWMLLIARIELSRAHLMSCVVYATVPAVSALVFGDVITASQCAGILLISVGAWVAGST